VRVPFRAGLAAVVVFILVLAVAHFAAQERDPYYEKRIRMVDDQLIGRGIHDERVIDAMRAVRRDQFVPEDKRSYAYVDGPLPIGYGQTISQPFTVALMTQLLDLEPGMSVLEIGTGSGYQAAVLAEITDQVYSVEVIPELASQAEENLRGQGYKDVDLLQADGYYGWPEHAPYDRIIVTAAPSTVPPPLFDQVKGGGKMVIPVGPRGGIQTMWLITRDGDAFNWENHGSFRFVPLTRS